MNRQLRGGIAALSIVAVTILASCGTTVPETSVDSSNQKSSTSTEKSNGGTSTTTEGAEQSDDTLPTESESTDTRSPTTEDQSADNDTTVGGDSFCDAAKSVAEFNDNDQLDPTESDPKKAFEAFKKTMNQGGEAINAMAESAPDEIEADMKKVEAAYDRLVDSLNSADSMDVLADMESTFDSPEVDSAADRVAAFVKDECGVDLEADPSN